MTSHSLIEVPEFSAHGTSHEIFLDYGLQLTNLLLDTKKGLPLSDEFNREIAADGFDWITQLSLRIRVEPKGRYTEQFKQLHRDRCAYFNYIGRCAKFVLEDPDRDLPKETREAARIMDELVNKRKGSVGGKSRPGTSTSLRFFLEDCEPKPIRAALEAIGGMRHFRLLQKTNAAYQDLLLRSSRREVDDSEAAAAPEVDAKTVPAPIPPSLRQMRQEATNALDQVFANMKQHAKKGREPYLQLLESCAQITAKMASFSKTQETRSRKAKAKEGTGTTPQTGTRASTARSSSKSGAHAAAKTNTAEAASEPSSLAG